MGFASRFGGIFAIGLFLLTVVSVVTAQYSGGTGDPNDPYQIATAADLIALGETPDDYDKHFILTADIDLDPNLPGGKVFDQAVIAPIGGFARGVGLVSPVFTGVFDGNNCTIRNLTIEGDHYLGLFGGLYFGAVVANLGLEAVDVNGTGHDVGALASYNYYGSIEGCYISGVVRGYSSVGGLVSHNYGSINNSYGIGTVRGYRIVGGFVAENLGSVSNSYSVSLVSGNQDVGGFVGGGSGSVASCFWNVQTSGQTSSTAGTGLTTAQMQDIETYLNAGWDFVDESLGGTCDLWQMTTGEYPKLRRFSRYRPVMPEGQGTLEDPYLVRDTRDIGTVWFKPRAHYRLETSIDMTGITWSAAVIPWFGGSFDGNGCMISNLHVRGGGYLGLIGQLRSGATVFNLGLNPVYLDATGNFVGGLAGYNGGMIVRCYSIGTVHGRVYAGGLAGFSRGSIANSYSTAAVGGYSYVGGLVGTNHGGMIINSYSIGSVPGGVYIGGLVGWNYDGSISSSFWDIEISGQATSAGGEGKTTAEMRTARTFLDTGWDFADETANGIEDIWWIDEGKDYPRLWWEPRPSVRLPVIELDATTFDAGIAEGVVLVDFFATWCSHCVTQAPILDEVADRLEGRAQVAKLDIDKARSIAQQYGVTGVPTLILFQDGVEIERFVGVTGADVLVEAILAVVDSM